jgi:hypothetical protein
MYGALNVKCVSSVGGEGGGMTGRELMTLLVTLPDKELDYQIKFCTSHKSMHNLDDVEVWRSLTSLGPSLLVLEEIKNAHRD